MKNVFKGLAATSLLAMLATSCAQEIVETNGDEGVYIGYGIAMGKHTAGTRVAEMSNTLLQTAAALGTGTPISVTAYPTGSTTPFATYGLSYDTSGAGPFSTGWTFNNSIPVLHPSGGLNHFAVYPNQTFHSPSSSGGSSVKFDYTVPAGGGVDLIAAGPANTTNANATSAKATLNFKHVLSQINFAIRGLDGYEITITAPKIKNVAKSGTYMLGGGSNSWTPDYTSVDEYTYAAGGFVGAYNATPTYLTSDATAPSAGNTNGLMLMPQTHNVPTGNSSMVNQVNTATDPYFTFDYEIKDAAFSGSNGFVTTGTAIVPLGHTSLTATWEPGKRYLYIITFESPIFLSYTVDVDSNPWTNGSDSDVDTDSNKNGNEVGETTGENGHNGSNDF